MTPTAPFALDPRIERSRRLVLTAAIDLLAEVGYGAITIEAIAARSGVAKSTIYRHWPGKLELIDDAFAELKPPIELRVGGSVRERVIDLLEQVATHVGSSSWSACLPAMIEAAERDPAVRKLQRKLTTQRRKLLVSLIREGVTSGQLAPHLDPEMAADCLSGAIFVRRLMMRDDLVKPTEIPQLVSQVLGPA
jgi:TetR/AcrR family transcriptional regulator, regulator of autoinduction and epiphytic fitness